MKKETKQISIDNGHTFITPEEAILRGDWDTLVHYMDDGTREAVHNELTPHTDLEFLAAYLEMATDDLIIG